MNLADDFNIWWNLPKYQDADIPAKQFSDVEIINRNASNDGWPGEEAEVKYWVELANGWVVGIITPRKKPATFPMYQVSEPIVVVTEDYYEEDDFEEAA